MKNLRLLYCCNAAFGDYFDKSQLVDAQMCTDNIRNINIFAAHNKIVAVCRDNHQVENEILIPESAADGQDSVMSVNYLSEQMAVCIVTRHGEIYMWEGYSDSLENVGTVTSGLLATAWSPDEELLALITGEHRLIIMSPDFDPITECDLETKEVGEAESVNVGWGKKETQFHGSAGKSAAFEKKEGAKTVFSWDDLQPRLSWRGDGQYFAVSYVNKSGKRAIQVWSREGALYSTGEDTFGLEQALGWKPSGSIIASSQRRPNKHQIVFFEKNGLMHGDFTLPFEVQEVKVKELFWNIDSSLLAVWCETMEGTEIHHYVQLWSCSNYHWYLKYEIRGTDFAAVCWDIEASYTLHTIDKNGTYMSYTFGWTTNCSAGQMPADLGLVGVIDGKQLLVTPFKEMVVPPPMSAYKVLVNSPIQQVIFGPENQPNDFAILFKDSHIKTFSYHENCPDASCKCTELTGAAGAGFQVQCKMPHLRKSFSLPNSDNLVISHLTWIHTSTFLYITNSNTGIHSILHIVNWNNEDEISLEKLPLKGIVYNLSYNCISGNTLLQLTTGEVLSYHSDSKDLHPFQQFGQPVHLPIQCPTFLASSFKDQEVAIGLTDRYRLYLNENEICNNCTSFWLGPEFLLLTTLSHTCRCILRDCSVQEFIESCSSTSLPQDESYRRVERGSKVVISMSEDTRLVLQMPRGNLETIHPRALTLSQVKKHLHKLEFGIATTMMKRHRINMNLLYDHDPEAFLKNSLQFIQQIKTPTNLNIFISDLRDEDVTKTMYVWAYKEENERKSSFEEPANKKIDTVCDAIIKTIEMMDNGERFILSTVTALVKKSCPDIEGALMRIQKLRDRPDASVSAEEALQYLIILVDVNELYDVALGTYDFDLVLMVAQKSNKDPKEYLPFLNDLRRLEDNYREYRIDRFLKRPVIALTHICKCLERHFDEALEHITQYKLFSRALQIVQSGSEYHKKISTEFGESLLAEKRYEEAGLAFSKACHWDRALEAWIEALNWQQAVVATFKLKYDENKRAEVTRILAVKLEDSREYKDAACLLDQYAKDHEEAIAVLIRGSEWNEALRLIHSYNREDLIETHLLPTLRENYAHQLSLLNNMREEFVLKKRRLAVVRQKKQQQLIEYMESGGMEGGDLYSDTSSITADSIISGSQYSTTSSQMSRASGKSGKARRKASRRKWSLKEGSKHEDLALIEALGILVRRTQGMTDESGRLCRTLVLFNFDKDAEHLQRIMIEFQSLISSSLPEIWKPDMNQSHVPPLPTGPSSTVNSITSNLQQMQFQDPEKHVSSQDAALLVTPIIDKSKNWHLLWLNDQHIFH